MTPFALQAAHMAARTMRDDPAFTGQFVGRPDEAPQATEHFADAFARLPVFHPPGAIRLITPLEDAALQLRLAESTLIRTHARPSTPPRSVLARLLDVLIGIARFPMPEQGQRRSV